MNPLDQLGELKARMDLARMTYDVARAVILAPVMAELTDLEDEYQAWKASVEADVVALEAEIKSDTLACGKTQDGLRYHAIYFHGRVSWNTEQLDTIAKIMPIIDQCRKTGDPYVVIKAK